MASSYRYKLYENQTNDRVQVLTFLPAEEREPWGGHTGTSECGLGFLS